MRFLDAMRYLAPGFDLRKFIKSFAPEVKCGKLWFPYEHVKSIKNLEETSLPPYEAFFSKLRGVNVLEEEHVQYEKLISQGCSQNEVFKKLGIKAVPESGADRYCFLQSLWKDRNMKSLKDFLKLYLEHDLTPFMKAVENMESFYKLHNIEVFKDHSTLPSLTLPLLFKSIPHNIYKPFLFLDVQNHTDVRNGVLGGLSLIGTRWIDANQSTIKPLKYGHNARKVKKIVGFDFNALYGGINGTTDQLGGIYCIRNKSTHYTPMWPFEHTEKNNGVSTWLKFRELVDKTDIQSALNIGEKCVVIEKERIFLDGYSSQNDTAYEYFGCFWHSHIDHCKIITLNSDEKHPVKKQITHEENYNDSIKRLKSLRRQFKNVVYIWECEWKYYMRGNESLKRNLYSQLLPSFKKTFDIRTENDMVTAIRNELIFGICFCDVNVPDHLREKHYEFPPIYVKINEFNVEKMHEPIRSYAKEHGIKPPSCFLTTLMKGTGLVLPTEMVKFYIDEGFEITNVTKVIQYEQGYRPFKKFLAERVQERREGHKNGASVISHMAKLLQNAAVGYTLLCEDKLTNGRIVTQQQLAQISRIKNIVTTDYIGPTLHGEQYLEKKKLPVKHLYFTSTQREKFIPSLPVVIGFKVLAMAKLHMLKFFQSIRKFLRDDSYEFIYSDTDSVYFAISEESFDDCVEENLKSKWEASEKHNWFVTNNNNDQFTPLLLKLEAEGTKFCALSPKMYVLCNDETEIVKAASKGIPYGLNSDLLTYENFRRALFDELGPQTAIVRGIRDVHASDGVCTVEQTRKTLSTIYAKRRVAMDHIHTFPLDYIPEYYIDM